MERLQAMMPVFLDCNFGNNKGILLGIMEEGITNEDIGPCHTFPWNSGERRVLVANCLFCFRISAPNRGRQGPLKRPLKNYFSNISKICWISIG